MKIWVTLVMMSYSKTVNLINHIYSIKYYYLSGTVGVVYYVLFVSFHLLLRRL